jgi:hypothetical protein
VNREPNDSIEEAAPRLDPEQPGRLAARHAPPELFLGGKKKGIAPAKTEKEVSLPKSKIVQAESKHASRVETSTK